MEKLASAYYRCSTTNQDLFSQRHKVREYARKHDYKIVKEFEDFGISGSIAERPAFLKLQDWIRKNPGKTVLTSELDRTSRDLGIFVSLRKLCKDHEVELIFTDLPKTNSTEINELLENIMASVGQFFKSDITNKMWRGKIATLKSGVPAVGRVPYGYQYFKRRENALPKVGIDEDEADIVRMIFDWYVNKKFSINKIRKELTIKKIKTRRKNSVWARSTIRGILANTAYIGKLYYLKTKQIPGTRTTKPRPLKERILIKVPVIIDKELFFKAQSILKKGLLRGPANKKYHYLLSGLVYCGKCGRKYQAYRAGYGARFYRCGSRSGIDKNGKSLACKNPIAKAEPLERAIFDWITAIIANPHKTLQGYVKNKKEILKSIKYLKKRSDELIKRTKKIDNQIQRLVDAYTANVLSLEELKAGKIKVEKKREKYLKEIEANIFEMEKLQQHFQSFKYLDYLREKKDFIKNREKMSFEEKQKLTQDFIEKVIVQPQRHHYIIEFKLPIDKMRNNRVNLQLKQRNRNVQNASVAHTLTFIKEIDLSNKLVYQISQNPTMKALLVTQDDIGQIPARV